LQILNIFPSEISSLSTGKSSGRVSRLVGYTHAFPPEYTKPLHHRDSVIRASSVRAACNSGKWRWGKYIFSGLKTDPIV